MLYQPTDNTKKMKNENLKSHTPKSISMWNKKKKQKQNL